MEESNKREKSEDAEAKSVLERIEITAKWATASQKVFALEKELEKAKKMRDTLEREHPFLGQIKGIVRKGSKKEAAVPEEKQKKAPHEAVKSSTPPKKKQKSTLDYFGLQQTESQRRVEDRLNEAGLRNQIERNPAFLATSHQVNKDPTFDPIEEDK
jgi:predicted ATPase